MYSRHEKRRLGLGILSLSGALSAQNSTPVREPLPWETPAINSSTEILPRKGGHYEPKTGVAVLKPALPSGSTTHQLPDMSQNQNQAVRNLLGSQNAQFQSSDGSLFNYAATPNFGEWKTFALSRTDNGFIRVDTTRGARPENFYFSQSLQTSTNIVSQRSDPAKKFGSTSSGVSFAANNQFGFSEQCLEFIDKNGSSDQFCFQTFGIRSQAAVGANKNGLEIAAGFSGPTLGLSTTHKFPPITTDEGVYQNHITFRADLGPGMGLTLKNNEVGLREGLWGGAIQLGVTSSSIEVLKPSHK